MVCYMAVYPDPFDVGPTTSVCEYGFYIQFGDGCYFDAFPHEWRSLRYGRNNTKHTDDAIYTPTIWGTSEKSKQKMGLGKALGLTFLYGAESDQIFVITNEKAGEQMLRALLMQALLLFPQIEVGDDMDLSAHEETAEFAYLMRDRIGVNFFGEARAAKYRTCEHCTCERCTGKGRDDSKSPSQIPFGKDPGSCDKIRDDKSDPSRVSIHAGPALRDRWRRLWRGSRRFEADAREKREKDRAKQIEMQMEVERERERDRDREKWGWGVAREEKRTSYF